MVSYTMGKCYSSDGDLTEFHLSINLISDVSPEIAGFDKNSWSSS